MTHYISFSLIEDNEPPKFTFCPASQTTETGPSESTAVAKWAFPEATDNSGFTNITCDTESGSLFEIGETDVICEALDLSRNSDGCTFSINVLGKTKDAWTNKSWIAY